tara:strand:- start:32 stop:223 length:192 start_codon:yes stop_codon:yes gene_type:complete
MSIIKKIIIILPIFFLSLLAQSFADEIKKIGKFKDWEAMVVTEATGKGLFCAIITHLTSTKIK